MFSSNTDPSNEATRTHLPEALEVDEDFEDFQMAPQSGDYHLTSISAICTIPFQGCIWSRKKIHELIESCNGYEAARFFHALNNMPLLAHDDFSIGVVDFRFRPLVWL